MIGTANERWEACSLVRFTTASSGHFVRFGKAKTIGAGLAVRLAIFEWLPRHSLMEYRPALSYPHFMEFRRLAKADVDNYFENRLRALQNAPSAFLTTYEEEKSRGSAHFERTLLHTGNERVIFGAVDNGTVVGAIGLFKEDRPKLNHKATIWGMYVDVGQRGKGVGAKLLDIVIQFAREQMKVATVSLSVESNNLPAKALYASRNFKGWGTEPLAMRSADGEYFSEDHMSLVL